MPYILTGLPIDGKRDVVNDFLRVSSIFKKIQNFMFAVVRAGRRSMRSQSVGKSRTMYGAVQCNTV
jgi:hypothetical protein